MNIENAFLRRTAKVALAVFIGWVTLGIFNLYRVHFPNREHAMISPLQDMRTFCVGRYQIDLPRGSVLYRAISAAGGAAHARFSAEQPVPRYRFENTVYQRWLEIQKLKVDELGKPFTQPAERIEVVPDGVLFAFNHSSIYAREWPDGSKGTQFFYETEGYLWRNETLFRFTDAPVKDRPIAAMRRLQPQSNTDIPNAQGFCTGHSFFPGAPEDGESTDFAFHLPTNPPAEFRIGTMGGGFVKQNPSMFDMPDLKMSFVRDTHRDIADLAGDEWIYFDASRRGHIYTYGLGAYWHRPEGESMSRQPSINVEMNIDIKDESSSSFQSDFPSKKAEGDIGKEEFLALWDGILKTLRPRPGAF